MNNKWIFFSLLFFSCGKNINKLDTLIPQPLKIEKQSGVFVISANTLISADTSLTDVSAYFSSQIENLTKMKLSAGQSEQGNIVLSKLKDQNDLGKEGYTLSIEKTSITISANEPNGIFYGVQTLLQLISADSSMSIPCGKITDRPRFAWRGYMLDLARMFYPVEYIKKHIDILALHKLNTLHLHLTDDEGGWRIEIKKYPKLTELGAWRENIASFEPGAKNSDSAYGGFYTQDELKDLINYAASRYITIIPEIEMPGHSSSTIYAYPEVSCFGKNAKAAKMFVGFGDPLCAGNEKTFELMEGVLEEVIALFPSKYIHIGGDECNKTAWGTCPKCQNRIKDEGLQDVEELQSYFIKRIEKFVTSKGKIIIGWDEILEGGLAPQATVMSWRGEEGGINAAKQGHDVIMAPNTNLYFDYYQTDEKNEDPTGMIGINKLDTVYSYDPMPAQLNTEESKHVLGVQACLWTTMVQNPLDLEVRTLPRLCALSEIAWSAKENKNYADFLIRMKTHYLRLMKYDYGFYFPCPTGITEYEFFTDKTTINLSAVFDGASIRYTLDNSEPNSQSALYTGPFQVGGSVILKARTFMPNGKYSHVVTSFLQKSENINPVTPADKTPGLSVSHSKGIIESVNEIKYLKNDSAYSINSFSLPAFYDTCDYFALDYSGYIFIEKDGNYNFYTTSDDGSALYLNDNLLVYNDGKHGKKEKIGKIPLKKGFYKIQLLYFDNHWGQYLKVDYEGAGIARMEIPIEILFH